MDFLAIAGAATHLSVSPPAAESTGGLTINLFWVIVGALNFLVFLALFRAFFSGPVSKMLDDRRARIERGLADAEAARTERERSAEERSEALTQARREAKEILDRAQKVAQETRDADIAATRQELERMRLRATADIEAERMRALADLRAEVADLALRAAGRVVGETMSDVRQRRLVDEFLREAPARGTNS